MSIENLETQDGFPTQIKTLLSGSKAAKLSQNRVWDLSLMYLNGQQNVRYDKSLQQYVTLRNQPGRNQLIVNLILNMFRAVVSRLGTNYPGVTVMPASPSNEDVAKAKASEELLKYFYHRENVKRDLAKAIEWLVSCGNVGLHEYYDPKEGCVKLDVVSPYDLFFEAGSTKPEESYYVAIRSIVRKADLEKAFPDKKDIIKNAPSISSDQSEDNSYPHTQSYNGEGYYYPRVELYEVYFKDGKHALVVGNDYLYKGETPIARIPVQFIRYTNLPDKLWGKGMVEGIIDLQNLYNKARNQVVQNVELMSNPKWLIPKTAGVNGSAIRGTPGEILYYNAAGGAPQQVPMAPLPGYVLDNIARLQSEMLDVAGIHSTTLGKRAVGVTSGKAIEALSAQDVSQLVMTQDNIEQAVKEMAECFLLYVKEFYTEEKMVRMFDDAGGMVFRKISNTDIVNTPEVFLEAGSLFRDEAQDRDAKVLNLLQLGLIPKEMAMKELSFKTGQAFVFEEIRAINHAQEMLDAVKAGAQIEVFANDDLKVFQNVFSDFMKTDAYYALSQDTRDYLRDILVAIVSYEPPKPDDPREAKVKYKVFPPPQKPEDIEEGKTMQEFLVSSPQGQDQLAEQSIENALLSNVYQTQRGQVRQQPQTNDLAVINRRATE